MSLLSLAFELFQLFDWDCECLVLACVEIKAQYFNENRVSLVDADWEINGGPLGVETKWLTLRIENSRSKKGQREPKNRSLFEQSLPFRQYVHDLFSQNQRSIVNDVTRLDLSFGNGKLAVVSNFDETCKPCANG